MAKKENEKKEEVKLKDALSANTADEVLQISSSYWQEAIDGRLPIKKIWDKIWELYNNKYDFTEKMAWQSKGIIPKLPTAAKSASAFLKRSLIRARTFFTVRTDKQEYKPIIPAIIKNIMAQLRKCKFVNNFVESLNGALLASLMIFKVYWEPAGSGQDISNVSEVAGGTELSKEKPQGAIGKFFEMLGVTMGDGASIKLKEGVLRVVPIDPYDFLLDPTGRQEYCIHVYKMELYKLKKLAKNKSNKYDIEVVNQIEGGFLQQTEEYEKAKRENRNPKTLSVRKEVLLKEFWGNLVDSSGKLIKSNCTWTTINDTHVLRKPIDNEFLHGKWPFVYGPLLRKAFSVYHKGFFEDGYSLAISITDIFNIASDTNKFASINAFEIDVDMIHDPEQLKTGIYPGKVIKKSSGGLNLPLIREIGLGKINPQNLRLYQEADREWQNSNGLTEFLMGKPASRGRPTATEVVEKGKQAGMLIEDLALDIEDYVFIPLLEMIFAVLIQYQRDFSDLRIAGFSNEVITFMESLAYLSDEEKRVLFKDRIFEFETRGMSGVIRKAGEFQKIIQFLGTVKEIPAIAQRLNLDYFITNLVESMEWDPQEVLLPAQGQQPQQPVPGQTPPPQPAAPAGMGLEAVLGGGAGGGGLGEILPPAGMGGGMA